MNASNSFIRVVFFALALLVVGLVLDGCGKKEGEEAKPATAQAGGTATATIENLKTAFGAESKRVEWYEKFAQQAQRENLGDIAVLFKALSRSEKVHAEKAAALLKSKGVDPGVPTIEKIPAGKARQYLKLSLSNENIEEATWAGFKAKAAEEQWAEATEHFRRSAEADARHGRLLKRAIEQETNFARLPYMMCPECGYIVGSDKIDSCVVCKTPKEKFQKI